MRCASGAQGIPSGPKAITEALGIMDELGRQKDEEHGSILSALGSLEAAEGRYKEALEIYGKARAVLVHYKELHEFGALEQHGR